MLFNWVFKSGETRLGDKFDITQNCLSANGFMFLNLNVISTKHTATGLIAYEFNVGYFYAVFL